MAQSRYSTWMNSAYSLWTSISSWTKVKQPTLQDCIDKQSNLERRLELINYPEDLLPEEYTGRIMFQIMATPLHLIGTNYFSTLDRQTLLEYWQHHPGKHPVTKTDLPEECVLPALHLQQKILAFVERQEEIFHNNPSNYLEIYKKNAAKEKQIAQKAYKLCKLLGEVYFLEQKTDRMQWFQYKTETTSNTPGQIKFKLDYYRLLVRALKAQDSKTLKQVRNQLISLPKKDTTIDEEIIAIDERIAALKLIELSEQTSDKKDLHNIVNKLLDLPNQNYEIEDAISSILTKIEDQKPSLKNFSVFESTTYRNALIPHQDSLDYDDRILKYRPEE